MTRFLRDNSLTLVFIGLFLLTLWGNAAAGYFAFNEEQIAHGGATYSFGRYLVSSDFGGQVMENWQSEFLQFAAFIVAAICLRQRGSVEAKQPGDASFPSDEEEAEGPYARQESPLAVRLGGLRERAYANSLLILMAVLFLASWAAQSVTDWSEYNSMQVEHGLPPVGWFGYLGSADFWAKTLQNWQSEFLAIASLVIFSVFLRQRGSAQSKRVGAPHMEST